MDFATAIKTCFRKYFVFTGRARRSEMWNFFLFLVLASIILSFLDALIFGTPMPFYSFDGYIGFKINDGPLGSIFSYLTLVPWLTVGVRRMHDIGRTGWWWGGLYLAVIALFVTVITAFPIYSDGPSEGAKATIGFCAIAMVIWFIVNFIFTLLDTQKGHNKYGPDPKYGDVESAFD